MTNVQKKWVIIINKQLKGPFTAQEIEAMFNKNMLSRNDIAMVVDENVNDPFNRNWKFLWQFSEFERRKEQPKVKTPVSEERRKTTPLPKIDEKLLEIEDSEFIFNKIKKDVPQETTVPQEIKIYKMPQKNLFQKSLFLLMLIATLSTFMWYYKKEKNEIKSTEINNNTHVNIPIKTKTVFKNFNRPLPAKRELTFDNELEEKKYVKKEKTTTKNKPKNKTIKDRIKIEEGPTIENLGDELEDEESNFGEIVENKDSTSESNEETSFSDEKIEESSESELLD